MSVDYKFITFIGFEVPLDFVFHTTTREVMHGRDCGHAVPDLSRFCPVCGAERPRMISQTTETIRPELGIDEDDVCNGRIVSGLPDGIEMHYYSDMCGSDALFVGWLLSTLDRDDHFHRRKGVPSIDRDALEAVLTERAIPHIAGTWGVHALAVGN